MTNSKKIIKYHRHLYNFLLFTLEILIFVEMNGVHITLIWRRLQAYELGKDVLLTPYHLALGLGGKATIVCDTSSVSSLPERFRDTVSLEPLPLSGNWRLRVLKYFRYLASNACHTDILMLFHWRAESLLVLTTYKLFNPKGKVYIKMDSVDGGEFDFSKGGVIRKKLKKRIYLHCLKKTDVISCERPEVYERVVAHAGDKAVLMPNGFDEELLQSLGIRDIPKEKLIITAGRLGTDQKNTEMLLSALSGMDLRDWKVALIGDSTPEFEIRFAGFLEANPQLSGKVELKGRIIDKKELWTIFAKASAFVLTSKWESYGLVLEEAARFANYIITTPVGAAPQILSRFPGESIHDVLELRASLARLIDKTDPAIAAPSAEAIEEMSWNSRIKPLVNLLK